MKRKILYILAAIIFAVLLGGTPAFADIEFDLVQQVDPYTGSNRYGDVWGEGDYAYIGSYAGTGVRIIDISTPGAAFLAATYDSTPSSIGQFKDVKVEGGIGYFASDNGAGVHIVDLSNPASPSFLADITSTISGFNTVHNVFIDGNYLYEVNSIVATVKVFDISIPTSPTFVRDIVTTDTSFIHDICVVNNRLATSGFGGTTDIYDVTDIGTVVPTLLGTVSSGSNSHSSWMTSDCGLLISAREISDGDIRIFDISNPASPILLSTIDKDSLGISAYTPHNPILFNDDLLFVSWYQAGVKAFNISDPANPVLIGSYDTYPGAVSGYDGNWGVYPLLGLDRILLSDIDGGLFILDASSVIPEIPDGIKFLIPFAIFALQMIKARRRFA